jgi:hypothetical protein
VKERARKRIPSKDEALFNVESEVFQGSSSEQEDEQAFMVTDETNMSKAKSLAIKGNLKKGDYVYDSGCSRNIYNDKSKMTKTWRVQVNLTGAHGKSQVKECGMHPWFGEGLIVDDCPVNLVSFGHNQQRLSFQFR